MDCVEAFHWSLGLISKMLVRTTQEGSTIVMKAINSNSAKALWKAISCAPSGERSDWQLLIQVGTRSISPLAWSIESGALESAQAIILDLLTFRADREALSCLFWSPYCWLLPVGSASSSTISKTLPVSTKDRFPSPDGHGILVMASGRLCSLGYATGHLSFVFLALLLIRLLSFALVIDLAVLFTKVSASVLSAFGCSQRSAFSCLL